jgi:hypothetical protein
MSYEQQYYLYDDKCGVEQSTLYLMSYYDAFQGLENMGKKNDVKGKHIPYDHLPLKRNETDIHVES